MDFDNFKEYSSKITQDEINFGEVIEKYLVHAKWFVFSVIFFLILSYFYLRKEIPRYEVSASVLIKDKEKGNSVDQLGTFENLGLFGSINNSLENEIHILTSRRLMKKVVAELKLNVKYFVENSPYNLEQFPNFPVTIKFPEDSITSIGLFEKKINSTQAYLKINVLNEKRFEYLDSHGNSQGLKDFGKIFKTEYGNLLIDLNDNWIDKISGKNIIITIYPLDLITDIYYNTLVVEPVDDKSRVISFSIKETIRQKGIAIINNLIEQYNADAIEDKNQVYKKTTEFLNDRITLITSELNAIESTAEQFKSSKGLINSQAGADIYLQSSSTNENDLIEVNIQLTLINHMISELNKNESNSLLPSNIGLSDASIIAAVGEYNDLVLQRNRILKSSTIKNPLIISLESQMNVLKNNLRSSLNSIKSSLLIEIDALNKQSGRIGSKIASVPKNEREYKDIIRQQETKNVVYLFLLQKREESILSNAITIDKARIVDQAYSNGSPVSPKPGVTYFAALLIGLLIPAGVIFIKESLDTKIHNDKDLRKLKIPYLGDVPHALSKKNLYVSEIDSSNIAEAFRYLRTNINFMLDRKDFGKTVFVTSTQSHEGKTFTAINLASSLAISGKKTLIVGMDLRAPKISKYLKLKDSPHGVSNFIINSQLTVKDITKNSIKFQNLDLIDSGDIPPNPVELLMSKRVDELFEEIQLKYEFIIVDTAPVGMVTDTIQIGKYADLTVYVVKANYLDKRMLHIPDKLHKEGKLSNMAFLINDSDHTKGAYGYGYKYGYGNANKKPWYKFLQK